jgi:hypothetical protein
MATSKTKSPVISKGYQGEDMESKAPSAGEITQWMRKCETGLLPIATDWLQNKLFSKGLQYLASAGDHTIMLAPVPQNAKRITVNVFSDKRRTLISKFTAQQPIPVVTPATSSSDDRATARECEHLLRWVWRKMELSRELDYMAGDVVDCGGGWWHIYWDPTIGEEKEVVISAEVMDLATAQPTIQKVRTGDVACHFVSNFEMRVDPSAMRLNDAMWIMRVSYMSTDVAERRWGKEVYADAAGTRPSILTPDWLLNPQRLLADDVCRIIECWYKPCDEYPTGFYAVITGSDVIHFENELPGGEFPFIYCEFDPDCDNFYGTTPLSYARRPQIELNGLLSQMGDGRSRGMFGAWLQPRGANMDIPTGAPLEVLGYNDNAGRPAFVQPQPTSEAAYRMVDVFMGLLSQTSGITDTEQATSGRDRLYAAEQDNTKLGPALRSLHSFLKRAAMRILNLYRDNAQFDVLYSVSDKNAESDVRAFSVGKIKYSSVEMSIDSALPLNRQAKREQVLMFYQAGLIDKSDALSMMEFGNIEDAMGTSNLDRERARNENLMLTVQAVGVEEFEDHAAHLEEHLAEMKQEKWYLLDDELKNNFRMHVNLHRQFVQAQLGQGQPPQGALTEGGGNTNNSVGAMAEVPAANAPNATLPIESPVSERDNTALGIINGRTME